MYCAIPHIPSDHSGGIQPTVFALRHVQGAAAWGSFFELSRSL